MTNEFYTKILKNTEYTSELSRMETNDHKPVIIALGGSHAYGTSIEGSDIDLRGVYLNNKSEILGIALDKEQYAHQGEIDMQIYSLKKTAWLLKACNPAMLEILGCRNDDYIYVSREGREIIQNLSIFLSKRATKTFGGYAASQLNRLINRSGRANDQILENERRSFEKSFLHLRDRYSGYIDKSAKVKQIDDQLLLSFSVENCPVGQVASILNEFNSIDRDYRKSVRNDKATTHGKLSKHMMHLIRLYMMGAELMSQGTVHTYRDGDEHELLMSIRRGEYLKEDGITPTDEFEKLVDEYQQRYIKACDATKLPDEPDEDAINNLLIEINEEQLKKSK